MSPDWLLLSQVFKVGFGMKNEQPVDIQVVRLRKSQITLGCQIMKMAGATGLEPATSAVTGQRSKPIELRPHTNCISFVGQAWWALKDSNL